MSTSSEPLGSGHDPMDAFDAHLVTGGYPRLLRECATAAGARPLVEQELTHENSSDVVARTARTRQGRPSAR
ncbi:hypothetical protein OG689_13260 [Kitasatospora sp. NBC_00240]|uniref:hypothetical protein n=1 Tax=Kitasatospora sp. NBC_00240 TaxID=2903567 RepID=UPI00224CFE5A|nr:hypothetical protein [Kitasatospora sp. NBC_00240]MCX5210246.1 hypothetical protein [Kitasatospora sp. NBC_00240]